MELILFAVEAVIFIILVLFLLALIDGHVQREEDKKLYETNREEWERRQQEREKQRQRYEQVMAESRAREIERANNITCPYCGSTHYTVMKRGWKVTTGFLGSSKVIRVCDNCLKKF